jgi:Family of unknown function (DUF5996)
MSELPVLSYEPWREAKETLHLWLQVAGKVKLATTAPRNHWWNITFSVTPRGLTSRTLRHQGTAFAIDFDLITHRLAVRTERGEEEGFELRDGVSVAAFDAALHETLRGLGLDVPIREEPFGLPTTTPFPDDRGHASYDPEATERFHRALLFADGVLEEFSGWFCGKASPVQLFWHGFDLAHTRFSGRRAPRVDADPVTVEAYSHEVVSFGFWAGDANTPFPSFYSYTAPEPGGLRDRPLRPDAARWTDTGNGSLAILPYDDVRGAEDPRTMLLAFFQSAYDAGSSAAGWDRDDMISAFCPTPSELERIVLRPGAPA